MNKREFNQLIRRYLRGEATLQEREMLDQWYDKVGSGNLPESSVDEAANARDWQRVHAHILKSKKPGTKHIQMTRLVSAIAASLLLIGVITTFFQLKPVPEAGGVDEAVAYVPIIWRSDDGEGPVRTLPDGSVVTLGPNSILRFYENWGKNVREVCLEGEGFFEVTSDKSRPFLVHTQEVTTKVLGTSFSIKAFPRDEDITVQVRTGKVSVYTDDKERIGKDGRETVLIPNQQVVVNKRDLSMRRSLVQNPLEVAEEKDNRMYFDSAPVPEILAAIEKLYHVDIDFDAAKLRSCTLTTSISQGSLYDRLDIICAAIDASYYVEETTIVVNAPGCER